MAYPWVFNNALEESSSNENSDDEYYESDSDDLYEQDAIHCESEKENYKYYIGISKLIKPYHYYLLLNSISSTLFFKYPYETVLNYLSDYSIIHVYQPKIDILKMSIVNNTYTVIKKTYWIRLIQRHWRKVLQNRMNILMNRCKIPSLRTFEITGRYPIGLNNLPGVYGMLSMYKK